MFKHTLSFALAVILVGCAGDTPPSTPTAVATPTPAPTPAATPKPTPTPVGNPFVRITANVIGFTRNSIPYSFVPTVYRPGDLVDLDCTPRDADGRATENHPLYAEWYPNSTQGGLVWERDYFMNRDNTYQPELYIKSSSVTGNLTVYCKAAGVDVSSNVINMPVR